MANKSVLCFVSGDRAYFTTCNLEEQAGDEWRKPITPNCNDADVPYYPRNKDDFREDGFPKWEVSVLKWVCRAVQLETPDAHWGPFISIHDINNGIAPWLTSGNYWQDEDGNPIEESHLASPVVIHPWDWQLSTEVVSIMAGTTKEEFRYVIESLGGRVEEIGKLGE
ncbi:MAG: hypothetical protein NTX72_02005 [Candidatus Uhrbacteria bacterium]|nr:hypothetical protein [Candidatus Uhrbacteria bacterium]